MGIFIEWTKSYLRVKASVLVHGSNVDIKCSIYNRYGRTDMLTIVDKLSKEYWYW